MGTLEIVILVLLSVVILSTFFLYLVNSLKIRKKAKKAKEEQERLKQEEKLEKEKKEQEEKNAKKQEEKKTEVIPVKAENSKVETIAEVTPVEPVEEIVDNWETDNNATTKQAVVENNKNLTIKEQIDNLSPEMKTIMFTDILKPKF